MAVAASTTKTASLPKLPPTVLLQGMDFHAVTENGVVRHVLECLDAGRGGWIVTLNLQHMHRVCMDPDYRDLALEAHLRVADGMPLVWAMKLQGTPIPERVAGSNLILSLSKGAAKRGKSVYLIGGAPGAADGTVRALESHCPGIRIAGVDVPNFGFENDPEELRQIEDDLCDAQPDIVYVALGSPKQEQIIRRLQHCCPNAWWIGVGISFGFLAGQVRRAPKWMQQSGLEWLHRLVQEPRRLFRRYLVEGVPFGVYLLSVCAWRRLFRRL